VVVLQKPVKPFTTLNVAIGSADVVARIDQLVAQRLVISFAMIMEEELAYSISQRSLTEEDESVEAFLL
jgi:hypothetical protein